jgi:hypothetical protein
MPPAPGNEGIEMPQISTEAQAVPQADPCWVPNNLGDEWRRHHFIYLVVVKRNIALKQGHKTW